MGLLDVSGNTTLGSAGAFAFVEASLRQWGQLSSAPHYLRGAARYHGLRGVIDFRGCGIDLDPGDETIGRGENDAQHGIATDRQRRPPPRRLGRFDICWEGVVEDNEGGEV